MKKLTSLILLSLLTNTAANASGKVSVLLPVRSRHYGTDEEYNEDNHGIGIAYKDAEVVLVKNSYSVWGVGLYYHPKKETRHVDIGIRLGVTTGYGSTPVDMDLAPIINPTVTLKHENAGIEFGVLAGGEDVDFVGTVLFRYQFK